MTKIVFTTRKNNWMLFICCTEVALTQLWHCTLILTLCTSVCSYGTIFGPWVAPRTECPPAAWACAVVRRGWEWGTLSHCPRTRVPSCPPCPCPRTHSLLAPCAGSPGSHARCSGLSNCAPATEPTIASQSNTIE